MKHIALYFGMVAALVASCSTQEEDFNTPLQDDVIFYASFEQPAEDGTRVYANEDLLLRWTADDRVSIFNKLTYNQEYKFLGETGDNAGGFNRVDNAEFVTGNPLSHVVSVYPYQASTKITEDETLSVTLPSEQHYAENTFGLGDNTMVSVSSDNVLQYKNVGGYLMLKMYGDGVSVSSITLKGNNGEKLAGKATVTMPMDGTPTVVMADDATTEITLVCDTPVALGATAEESKQFWFVVPPVTLSEGFTFTVNDSSGGTFEKTTDKTIAIERNILSKMAPIEVVPVINRKYLTFTSEGRTRITLSNNNNHPVLFYSRDKINWLRWDYSELTFTSQQPLYFYGDNPDGFSKGIIGYSVFNASGSNFAVSGNIMSLIDSVQELTSFPPSWNTFGWFAYLFSNCTGLISGPDLPATTLQDYTFCYEHMFSGCTSLKVAPALPATTLSEGCYYNMFSGCTSLTEAPDLPASTLAMNCYSHMFSGCTSLTKAPDLPATTLQDCISCYEHMFSGCTSLTKAPDLPATTLASNCYEWMFSGCTSLTKAPDLPASTLETDCYYEMFSGCTQLNYVKCLATVYTRGDLGEWLSGVASTGTFIKAHEVVVDDLDDFRWSFVIPEGWTVVDDNLVPEAVDLGLPSGLKWASFNLGATKPEEYGDYYAWGETEPYYSSLEPLVWKEGKEAGYDWSSYRWSMGSEFTMTKYCTPSPYEVSYGYNGFTDGRTVLDPEDDAAQANLGGNWRMPTDEEWTELRENCTWTRITLNGVDGKRATGPNGNWVFLPAAGFWEAVGNGGLDIDLFVVYGYYWSSSLFTDIPYYAWSVMFNARSVNNNISRDAYSGCRNRGFSIRPVCE